MVTMKPPPRLGRGVGGPAERGGRAFSLTVCAVEVVGAHARVQADVFTEWWDWFLHLLSASCYFLVIARLPHNLNNVIVITTVI